METVDIKTGGHSWEKQNIVTLFKAGKPYDLYKCTKCGLTGKSIQLGKITIRESDLKKVIRCKGIVAKKSIKITYCNAVGEQFKRLTPGSIHNIMQPPAGEDNKRGEWVMGTTEPVLLLFGEFEYSE
jgi:hypothetical protein